MISLLIPVFLRSFNIIPRINMDVKLQIGLKLVLYSVFENSGHTYQSTTNLCKKKNISSHSIYIKISIDKFKILIRVVHEP